MRATGTCVHLLFVRISKLHARVAPHPDVGLRFHSYSAARQLWNADVRKIFTRTYSIRAMLSANYARCIYSSSRRKPAPDHFFVFASSFRGRQSVGKFFIFRSYATANRARSRLILARRLRSSNSLFKLPQSNLK